MGKLFFYEIKQVEPVSNMHSQTNFPLLHNPAFCQLMYTSFNIGSKESSQSPLLKKSCLKYKVWNLGIFLFHLCYNTYSNLDMLG